MEADLGAAPDDIQSRRDTGIFLSIFAGVVVAQLVQAEWLHYRERRVS
jgi:hypothetical protein